MDTNMSTREIIKEYDIPQTTISDLTGIVKSEVSECLRNRKSVTEEKALRIEEAVADIVMVLDAYAKAPRTFGLPSVSLNLRDVEGLKQFIKFVKSDDSQAKLERQMVATLAVLQRGQV